MYDGKFVHKAEECIDVTAGYKVIVDEPVAVKPKDVIKAALKDYNKMLADLLKQGYPRSLAEKLAAEYVTNGS